jgi:hypothetical protein
MSGVFLSGHFNSTLFTSCCHVAICNDEDSCPKCGEEVPYTPKERWNMGMQGLYGHKKLAEIRASYSEYD